MKANSVSVGSLEDYLGLKTLLTLNVVTLLYPIVVKVQRGNLISTFYGCNYIQVTGILVSKKCYWSWEHLC